MQIAIEEAKKGLKEGGIPIGAVLVKEGKMLSKGHNMRVQENDPLMHAEIECIRNAGRLKNYGSTILYSTLMPCVMCAGALVLARVDRLVFGAKDPKFGACMSLYNIVQDIRLNHQLEVVPGILEDRAAELMKTFFQAIRTK